MKTLNQVLTTTALAAGLNACASAPAIQPALSVQSYTAGDAGFDVNSHLIMGSREALLVDAQFTRSEARKVAAMVKASGRDLRTIFVTHGHPDHYFGLEVLTQQFPQAQVLATPETIAEIKATSAGKLGYWKPIYKDDLTDSVVMPQPFSGSSLSLEGEEIRLVPLKGGESEEATALYIPSIQTLVAGDLAYSGVHLWLAEGRPEGWLKNLEAIRKVGLIEKVLPGHGAPGGTEILDADARYIENFVKATSSPTTKESALAKMKVLYPGYKLPVILDIAVGAALAK